jgi:ABC-type amino acid transport substrate-binding protein
MTISRDVIPDPAKRKTLRMAAGTSGLAFGAIFLEAGAASKANAQILESGIDPKSVLARIKKDGKIRVGYAQTVPWFNKNAATGKFEGIYYDVIEKLAAELEVKTEYHEVTWANATVGLRKGDYDIFGSSLFYTIPRALVVSYVYPMWRQGRIALTHKDNASRFKSAADFNKPDVTFSVNVGSSEENWVKATFPQAKIITTSGNIALSAEPVRAKKADLWITGDLAVRLFAQKNPWAHVIDGDRPIGLTPNTWAIRYGDPEWKAFLDMWANFVVGSGYMKERYDHYWNQLSKT